VRLAFKSVEIYLYWSTIALKSSWRAFFQYLRLATTYAKSTKCNRQLAYDAREAQPKDAGPLFVLDGTSGLLHSCGLGRSALTSDSNAYFREWLTHDNKWVCVS